MHQIWKNLSIQKLKYLGTHVKRVSWSDQFVQFCRYNSLCRYTFSKYTHTSILEVFKQVCNNCIFIRIISCMYSQARYSWIFLLFFPVQILSEIEYRFVIICWTLSGKGSMFLGSLSFIFFIDALGVILLMRHNNLLYHLSRLCDYVSKLLKGYWW